MMTAQELKDTKLEMKGAIDGINNQYKNLIKVLENPSNLLQAEQSLDGLCRKIRFLQHELGGLEDYIKDGCKTIEEEE